MIDGARWVAVLVALAMIAVPTMATQNGPRTHDPAEDCRDRIRDKLSDLARRSPRTVARLRDQIADRIAEHCGDEQDDEDDDDPRVHDRRGAFEACKKALHEWHRNATKLMKEHAREWEAFHNETRTQMRDLVADDNVSWREIRSFHRERAQAAHELMQEHRREWHDHLEDRPTREDCLPPTSGTPGHHPPMPRPCALHRDENRSATCRIDRVPSRHPARCMAIGC